MLEDKIQDEEGFKGLTKDSTEFTIDEVLQGFQLTQPTDYFLPS
jgi:hypothetical protein